MTTAAVRRTCSRCGYTRLMTFAADCPKCGTPFPTRLTIGQDQLLDATAEAWPRTTRAPRQAKGQLALDQQQLTMEDPR